MVILGDTIDSWPISPLALDADLLSHEATFKSDLEHKAYVAQHSTGHMAGAFAAMIRAKHLVLTHFSARENQYVPNYVSARMYPAIRAWLQIPTPCECPHVPCHTCMAANTHPM